MKFTSPFSHIKKLVDVDTHFTDLQRGTDSVLVSKGNLIHYGLIYITLAFTIIYAIVNLLLESALQSLLSFGGFAGAILALLLHKKGFTRTSKIVNMSVLVLTIGLFFYFPYEHTLVHTNDSVLAFYIPVSIGCLIAFQGAEKKLGLLMAALILIVMGLLLGFDQHEFPETIQLTSGSQQPDISLNIIGAAVATFAEVGYILLLSNKLDDSLIKANQELDNFVYSVSHDLRSPLLLVQGMLDLSDLKIDNKAEVLRYHSLARQGLKHQDQIIREILAYSRNARTELKEEKFDLREQVQEILRNLPEELNHRATITETYDCCTTIWCDKGRLNTVLRNIISNAVKYQRKNIPDPWVKIHTGKNAQGEVMITVSDNGEGIPDTSKAHIFDMFYRGTTTGQGSGLGLYICREMLHKMKARYTVDSEIGKGTRFVLILPQPAGYPVCINEVESGSCQTESLWFQPLS